MWSIKSKKQVDHLLQWEVFSMKDRLHDMACKAFQIIELVEASGVNEKSFKIIRKRLLDLGNDIIRLDEEEGD